tara:strand:- start:2920 stop:3525 length:606 start_codon:yes stop_codon:yes gene_type:complete
MLYTDYLTKDGSLWGAMQLFSNLYKYDDVVCYHQTDEKTYENYFDALSLFWDGEWKRPKFKILNNNQISGTKIPNEFFLGKFNCRPKKKVKKMNTMTYSFIINHDKLYNHGNFNKNNRIHKKENIDILLKYLRGVDLGNSRGGTKEEIYEKFLKLHQSHLYLGSPCTWSVTAKILNVPTLFLYPNEFWNQEKANRTKDYYK